MPLSIEDALHHQFYADTFHDFGKNNNDRRCIINKNDVVGFHVSHLKQRPMTTSVSDSHIDVTHPQDPNKIIDEILPEKMHTHTTYERSVAHFIDTKIDEPELIQHITVPKESVAELIASDTNWGVLEDMGGAKFLLSKKNMLNVQTIASYFDEAPKTQMEVNHIVVPIHGKKIYMSGHIHFGYLQDPKETNYVGLHNHTVNGQEVGVKYDRTLLNIKILDLRVRNLCTVISNISKTKASKKQKISGSVISNPEDMDLDWSIFEKLIHKNFQNLVLPVKSNKNLKETILEDFKHWINSYTITDDKISCAINALYDIKRSLDAGQVEMAKYLQDSSMRVLPEKPIDNVIFLTKDVLCYERAKLKGVNVVSKRRLDADLFLAKDIDYTLLIRRILNLMKTKHASIYALMSGNLDPAKIMIDEKNRLFPAPKFAATRSQGALKDSLRHVFYAFFRKLQFKINSFFFFAAITIDNEDRNIEIIDNVTNTTDDNVTDATETIPLYLHANLTWSNNAINHTIRIKNMTTLLAKQKGGPKDDELKGEIIRQMNIYKELKAKYDELCMIEIVLTPVSDIVLQYRKKNTSKIRNMKRLYIQSWLDPPAIDHSNNPVQASIEQKIEIGDDDDYDEENDSDDEEDDEDDDDEDHEQYDKTKIHDELITSITFAISNIDNNERAKKNLEKFEADKNKKENNRKKKKQGPTYRDQIENAIKQPSEGKSVLENFVDYLFSDDVNTDKDIANLSYALKVFGKVNIKAKVINGTDKLVNNPKPSKHMAVQFTLEQKAFLYYLNIQVDMIHGYDLKALLNIAKKKVDTESSKQKSIEDEGIRVEEQILTNILNSSIIILKPVLYFSDEASLYIENDPNPTTQLMQKGGDGEVDAILDKDMESAFNFIEMFLNWIDRNIVNNTIPFESIEDDLPTIESFLPNLLESPKLMIGEENEILYAFATKSKMLLDRIESLIGVDNFQAIKQLIKLLEHILNLVRATCIIEFNHHSSEIDIEILQQLLDRNISILDFLTYVQKKGTVIFYYKYIDVVERVTQCKDALERIAYPIDTNTKDTLLSDLHSKVFGHILNVTSHDNGLIRLTQKNGSPLFITSDQIALYKRVLARMFDEQVFEIVQSFPKKTPNFMDIYANEFTKMIGGIYGADKDPMLQENWRFMWDSDKLIFNIKLHEELTNKTLPTLSMMENTFKSRRQVLKPPLASSRLIDPISGGNSFAYKGIYYQYSDITQKRLIYYNLRKRDKNACFFKMSH